MQTRGWVDVVPAPKVVDVDLEEAGDGAKVFARVSAVEDPSAIGVGEVRGWHRYHRRFRQFRFAGLHCGNQERDPGADDLVALDSVHLPQVDRAGAEAARHVVEVFPEAHHVGAMYGRLRTEPRPGPGKSFALTSGDVDGGATAARRRATATEVRVDRAE